MTIRMYARRQPSVSQNSMTSSLSSQSKADSSISSETSSPIATQWSVVGTTSGSSISCSLQLLTLPQVVANAVTALTDIHQTSIEQGLDTLFIIDSSVLQKLLVALNECTEWGRIAILSALARYRTTDEKEAEHICERVMPQFQHANGAVVLSAVKVSHTTSSLPPHPPAHSHLLPLTGRHDSHGPHHKGRIRKDARTQNGTAPRHTSLRRT